MGSLGCTKSVMAADYLNGEQIAMFQDAFNLFDSDADGAVNVREVGMILKAVGQNPSEAEIQDMVMAVDKDGTGSVDFPEFLMMMAHKINAENAEDDIREAFKVFDGDGNGYINRYELSIVMANIGEKLTPGEIQAMI